MGILCTLCTTRHLSSSLLRWVLGCEMVFPRHPLSELTSPPPLNRQLPSVLPEQKQHPFVQDGVKLELLSYESNPISVALPNKVEIEVAVTEPQPKGATIKVGAFKSCEVRI